MNCTILNTQIPYKVIAKNIKINKLPTYVNNNYNKINIKNDPNYKNLKI